MTHDQADVTKPAGSRHGLLSNYSDDGNYPSLQFSVDVYFFWNVTGTLRAAENRSSLDKSGSWMPPAIWNADCNASRPKEGRSGVLV